MISYLVYARAKNTRTAQRSLFAIIYEKKVQILNNKICEHNLAIFMHHKVDLERNVS